MPESSPKTSKIRVLHLGTSMAWRGGENQIRILIEGLDRDHFESFIAYPKKSRAIQILSKSFKCLELNSRLPWDPFNLYSLCSFVDRCKIQILDAHSSKAHSLALYLKKLRPHLRLVVHRRVDTPPTKTGRRKYLHPALDQVVAISQFIGNMMKDMGVPEEKLRVIRSAVPDQDLKKETALPKNIVEKVDSLSMGTVVLGSASALDPQKGIDVLLDALAELPAGLNYHLFIVGTGKSEALLKKKTFENRLQNKVSFLGFIKETKAFLSRCHIQVAASRNEGLGTVFLEGALAGCALIGTNVGGIPEIIQSKQTGLLVEPENPGQLAAALKELIESQELRNELSENAKNFARKNFSSQKMIQENADLYMELS